MKTRRILIVAFVLLSVLALIDMALIGADLDDGVGFRWEFRWETSGDDERPPDRFE